jgi:hypothetical protein
MQRQAPSKKGGQEHAKLPQAQGRPAPGAPPQAQGAAAQGTHAQAIDLILEGVPRVARSVRVLLVGASQKGKTTFAKKLCAALAQRGTCGTLVIFDQKFPDLVQYAGQPVTTIAALRKAILEGVPAVVCRAPLTVEEAAAAVREAAECGERATLLLDEIAPGLKVNASTGEPMNQVWCGPSPIWLCLQGGGLGASFIELCQLPKMVPGSFIDNATTYVFFGTGGRSLSYSVDDLKLVPRDAAATVAGLQVGQCCVFFPDRDWDRKTYASPA